MELKLTVDELRTALESAVVGSADSQLEWLFGKERLRQWEEDDSDEKVFREVWFQLKKNLKIDDL
jgi:hypothetical protein